MSLPISELIDRNIVTTLQGVTTGNGYNVTLTVERWKVRGNAVSDYKTIVTPFPDTESDDADTPLGMKQWVRPYKIYLYIVEPEDSATSEDELVNTARADIEKALMQDTTRGGYARNTEIRSPLYFGDETDFGGVIVNVDVVYRTAETDPYSQNA